MTYIEHSRYVPMQRAVRALDLHTIYMCISTEYFMYKNVYLHSIYLCIYNEHLDILYTYICTFHIQTSVNIIYFYIFHIFVIEVINNKIKSIMYLIYNTRTI